VSGVCGLAAGAGQGQPFPVFAVVVFALVVVFVGVSFRAAGEFEGRSGAARAGAVLIALGVLVAVVVVAWWMGAGLPQAAGFRLPVVSEGFWAAWLAR
jgi:hypothetical protein